MLHEHSDLLMAEPCTFHRLVVSEVSRELGWRLGCLSILPLGFVKDAIY